MVEGWALKWQGVNCHCRKWGRNEAIEKQREF